jgi:hypothetical protein
MLKGGKICFGSWFQSMTGWAPLLLGLWQSRNSMAEGHGRRKLLILLQPGNRETRMGEREQRHNLSFKQMPTSGLRSPTRLHSATNSPSDLITSQQCHWQEAIWACGGHFISKPQQGVNFNMNFDKVQYESFHSTRSLTWKEVYFRWKWDFG